MQSDLEEKVDSNPGYYLLRTAFCHRLRPPRCFIDGDCCEQNEKGCVSGRTLLVIFIYLLVSGGRTKILRLSLDFSSF